MTDPQQPGDFTGPYPFGPPPEQYLYLFESIRLVDRIGYEHSFILPTVKMGSKGTGGVRCVQQVKKN